MGLNMILRNGTLALSDKPKYECKSSLAQAEFWLSLVASLGQANWQGQGRKWSAWIILSLNFWVRMKFWSEAPRNILSFLLIVKMGEVINKFLGGQVC